jgi:hypothetical protein
VLARVAGTPTLVVGWPPRLDGLESDKKKQCGVQHGVKLSLGGEIGEQAVKLERYYTKAWLTFPTRRLGGLLLRM